MKQLRIVYDDYSTSYSEFIMAKNEPTIHQHNIKIPMKEMCKFENNLSPPLINEIFQVRKDTFNLRYFQKIANNNKKNSVKMGLETIS